MKPIWQEACNSPRLRKKWGLCQRRLLPMKLLHQMGWQAAHGVLSRARPHEGWCPTASSMLGKEKVNFYLSFIFLLLPQLNQKIFSFSLGMTLGKVFHPAVQGCFPLHKMKPISEWGCVLRQTNSEPLFSDALRNMHGCWDRALCKASKTALSKWSKTCILPNKIRIRTICE